MAYNLYIKFYKNNNQIFDYFIFISKRKKIFKFYFYYRKLNELAELKVTSNIFEQLSYY